MSVTLFSSIDDIVLDYIAGVLVELDSSDGDTSFDVDQFVEMISAYVPEFADIERWVHPGV